MACGIFATLIMGMFLRQIANLFPSDFNSTLIHLSGIATGLTGIGIGVGVACQLQEAPLVVLCAGIAGMLGGDAAGPSAFLCSFLAGRISGGCLGRSFRALFCAVCWRQPVCG